jgi:biopolymer transport protein ExbD|tara:strand:- start:808 stop:1221 length:414 start_codon:yes stop_codon:yes gene_type:complete
LNFKKKKSPEINLEITPLVDVIFLLLIFFVLSTQFIDLKSMSIDLPSIDKKTMSNLPENRVKIEISKEGDVLINNIILDTFSLKSLNKELRSISPEIKTAIISADSDTKYQYLVTIMESLNRNGFKNIQINGVSQVN